MQHLAAHILQLVETALTGIDGSVNYQAAEVDVPDYNYRQKLVRCNAFVRAPLGEAIHHLIENQARLRERLVAIVAAVVAVIKEKKESKRIIATDQVKELVDLIKRVPAISDGLIDSDEERKIWFGFSGGASFAREKLQQSYDKLVAAFRAACGEFISTPYVMNMLSAAKSSAVWQVSDVVDFDNFSLSADFGVTQILVQRASEGIVREIDVGSDKVLCSELVLLPKALTIASSAWKVSESFKVAKKKDKLTNTFPAAMNDVDSKFKTFFRTPIQEQFAEKIPDNFVYLSKLLATAGPRYVEGLRLDFENFIVGVLEKEVKSLKELAPDGISSAALPRFLSADDYNTADIQKLIAETQTVSTKKIVAKWAKMEPTFKTWNHWFVGEANVTTMVDLWRQTDEVRTLVATNTRLTAIYAPIGIDQKRCDIIKRTVELKVEHLVVALDPKLDLLQKKLSNS